MRSHLASHKTNGHPSLNHSRPVKPRDAVDDTILCEVMRALPLFETVWVPGDPRLARKLDSAGIRDIRQPTQAEDIPCLSADDQSHHAVLLSHLEAEPGNTHAEFSALHPRLARSSRVFCIVHRTWGGLFRSALSHLGLRGGKDGRHSASQDNLVGAAHQAGFEVTRIRPTVYCPRSLLGIGTLINRLLPAVPILRWCALSTIYILRPVKPSPTLPSLSVIIPARDECGNVDEIFAALTALRHGGIALEAIIVEGHSTDGTWEALSEHVREHEGTIPVTLCKQPGSGKADALRAGLALSKGELVAILDADLTVPPEAIGDFIRAFAAGSGDFLNGSRLELPMERGAMPFLNRIANAFFARTLSFILGTPLADTLCGTKAFPRAEISRLQRLAPTIASSDPFGDFELLFPAALLGIGIINVPVRYRKRRYGSTKISRLRHGLLLLKMTARGLVAITAGGAPPRKKRQE